MQQIRSLKHSATQSIRQRRYDKLTAIFLITDYAYLSVGRCGAIAVLVLLTGAIGGQLIIFPFASACVAATGPMCLAVSFSSRPRIGCDLVDVPVRVIAFTYLLGLLAMVLVTLFSRFFAESFPIFRAGIVVPADVVQRSSSLSDCNVKGADAEWVDPPMNPNGLLAGP